MDRFTKIVDAVERLNSTEVEELFKLLHRNKCNYTLNNNGVFINLSWIHERHIQEIERFTLFCEKSRRELLKYEHLCTTLVQNMQQQKTLENNDETPISTVSIKPTTINIPTISTSTSTMRFYLLKKKFSKQMPPIDQISKDASSLEPETYLLT